MMRLDDTILVLKLESHDNIIMFPHQMNYQKLKLNIHLLLSLLKFICPTIPMGEGPQCFHLQMLLTVSVYLSFVCRPLEASMQSLHPFIT